MKLWQKIFLCAFGLTMLGATLISMLIIQMGFRNQLYAELRSARLENSYLSAGIRNKAAYQREADKKPFLGVDRIRNILIVSAAGQTGGVAVYDSRGECLTAANMPIEPREGEMLASLEDSPLSEKECRVEIRTGEYNARYAVAVSRLSLENSEYELYTLRYITIVYDDRERQLFDAQIALLVFALLDAVVLLFVTRLLCAPLRRVNRGIGEIARGKYSLRLPEKGSREFRELSQNVNVMAKSVEENVERLQDVADSRKRFIDNLAHEMKTPLTSILGFADLLRVKRTVTDKQRRDFSGVIVEEAKRLQTLSGKLLELAVANNAAPEYGEIHIDELFREMSLTMAPLLSRRQVRLLCQSNGEKLWADRELVKSLLYNLIDNAAKASTPGEEVLLRCDKGEETVILSVTDWGIGMDEKTVKRATEAFYMADKSRSRKNGGAGLGLALCVRITEMHGATLRIKSRPGEGTAVFLAFPETPPRGEKKEAAP